jgi:uncharacterized protein (DUF1330 family)
MSAYMVFNYAITNPEGYKAYPPAAGSTLASHGGEVLVADYESEVAEGMPGHVTVVLRFESKEAARAWYESSEYQAAQVLRTANTDGLAVICDGFAMPS